METLNPARHIGFDKHDVGSEHWLAGWLASWLHESFMNRESFSIQPPKRCVLSEFSFLPFCLSRGAYYILVLRRTMAVFTLIGGVECAPVEFQHVSHLPTFTLQSFEKNARYQSSLFHFTWTSVSNVFLGETSYWELLREALTRRAAKIPVKVKLVIFSAPWTPNRRDDPCPCWCRGGRVCSPKTRSWIFILVQAGVRVFDCRPCRGGYPRYARQCERESARTCSWQD